MDNIFGLSMTTILITVLVIMVLCLLTTALIALRNRVIFKMAVRNIPRRKAQTILIMVGLMLSTLIIAASLTTGDTLDYSIKHSTYAGLGQTDETISFVGDTDNEGEISVNNVPIPVSVVDHLEEQLSDDSEIDGFMPLLTIGVPAVNLDARLSEPNIVVSGVDPARIESFGGFKDVDGNEIDLASYTTTTVAAPPGLAEQLESIGGMTGADGQPIDLSAIPVQQVVISDDLADNLEAQVGDILVFFFNNQPHTVSVKAIAPGSLLTGLGNGDSADLLGIAAPIGWVQQITDLEGQARFIAVSNTGGVESGADATDSVMPKLRDALDSLPGGEGRQLGVNPVKQDAIKGAELFGNIFMSFFLLFGLFSVAAGVLLIFLIFMMLAAERRSEMGMSRAVGMKRRHLIQGFIAEGTAYDLGAALIGAAAGVGVAFAIVGIMGRLIGQYLAIHPHATFRSLMVAYALGVTVTFLTIIFASVRSSRLNIVQAIRDLPEHKAPQHLRPKFTWKGAIFWPFRVVLYYIGWGTVLGVVGALLMLQGAESQSAFWFSLGLSIMVLGIALFLRRFLPERPVYTIAAAIMLLYWLLPLDALDAILPEFDAGGIEMFFLSGIFMVMYATLIMMWNAEVIVAAISLVGRVSSRWIPAVKTAVAYPLAAKGRTGMTIAMFSLVIFSLVTLTTLNKNFSALFSSEDADAGWQISVVTSPANPVGDLKQELDDDDVDLERITAVGRLDSITYFNAQLRNPGQEEWKRSNISGMDLNYIENAEIPLQARAAEYTTDQSVWDAISAPGSKFAIIDSFSFDSGDNFGNDPDAFYADKSIQQVDGVIPAFNVELQNARTGAMETVTVIGVIDSKVSTLFGVYIPQDTFSALYGTPDFQNLFVKLNTSDTAVADDVAKQIESGLLEQGVQADSIQSIIDEQTSIQSGFLNLLQGFMGLGLFVGIAALGVISFRSVVERRQQIGMLRAIGYQKSMVAVSFLLESLVVAALGVLSGTIMAVILSYNLINSEDFNEGAEFTGFVVPWGTIVFFIVASLVAAAFMTWVPARKASSVPIAEALRYE